MLSKAKSYTLVESTASEKSGATLLPPQHAFRTAVPFWGRTTQILSSLSPKRDSSSRRIAGAAQSDSLGKGYAWNIRPKEGAAQNDHHTPRSCVGQTKKGAAHDDYHT